MFVFAIIFIQLFCSNVAFKLEQSCSKFHYEEQTLEKLIRLQIFVENIKNEVDTTQSKVDEELKALTREREQLQTEVQTMKDDIERSKSVMEADWSTTKTQYSEIFKKYNDDLTDRKESLMVPAVAFQSSKVTDTVMADNKVIVFSNNLHNYNGSYDNKIGIFTVPLDGIYIFITQLSMASKSYSYYGIYVNEISITHGLLGDENYYNSFSLAAVVHVTKGDRVAVRCVSSCGGDNLYEHPSSSSSFSGILIHRK